MSVPNIWVGSKPKRGSSFKYPIQDNCLRIDVSSGSMKKIDGFAMKNLSPLFIGPVTDTEGNSYITFENLWQYNKVYAQLGHWDTSLNMPTEKWYKWRQKGMSLLKNGKGIRTPPEVSKLKKAGDAKPIGAWWDNKLLGYIDSRKQIYIPKYIEAIKLTEEYNVLKKMVDKNIPILIIELDGPSLDECPNGMIVTKDNINEALHNERYPYGHGYVLAMSLADI